MDLTDLYQHFIASKGVTTDTRGTVEEKLFFALRGDHFNGNKFADEALKKGAKAVVVDDPELPDNDLFLHVDDSLRTLQRLATYHRNHLDLPILAITGSNGKTTTKELMAQVLSRKFNLTYTQGNLNNHIGVPLTLLSMRRSTDFGIVEMGANHQGEITTLCEIAQPDYGYITNFGKAHLEGFGGIKGVIKGKSELYDFLRDHHKTTVVNADDDLQVEHSHHTERVSFGRTTDADCQVKFLKTDPYVVMQYDDQLINSRLLGEYNADNIAAAICLGDYFDVPLMDIKKAIESYEPTNNRSQVIEKENKHIILDAYNANPTSVEEALKTLVNYPADYKIAILGDMFEVGTAAADEHQRMIDILEDSEIDEGYVCGEHFNRSRVQTAHQFADFEALKEELASKKIPGSSAILIKGSRGMAMERLIDIF